jgi:hypothetical protein
MDSDAQPPWSEALPASTMLQEKLAKFGVDVAEEEAVWKQELEDGVKQLEK